MVFLGNKKNFIIGFIAVSFFCKPYISIAQEHIDNEKEVMDSIAKSADLLSSPFEKMKKLTSIAGQYHYTKNTRIFIDKALELSKRENDPVLFSNTYYSLGNYFFFNSQLDSSMIYLKKAEDYIPKGEQPFLAASILATKGGIYKQRGAVSLSISTTMEAKNVLDRIDTLSLSEEEKFKYKGQNLVLNNSLANLYSQMEDYETSIVYYNLAYQAAIKIGSIGNAGVILSNKGDLLIKMKRFEEGLETLKKGKQLKIEGKAPPPFIASSDLNMGVAYFEIGEYDLALESYNKALSIDSDNNVQSGLAMTLAQRGLLYNRQEKYREAIIDCEKAKEIAFKINDLEYQLKSCNCLFEAYKGTGDFQKSLQNHELYLKAKDSLFNENNIKKLTQIEMQYAFDKKEELQKLIIEKKNRQKNLILIGLIALGILALMLFVFFRKRLQYQKTIAQQTETLHQQKITELQQKNKLLALSSMIEGQEAERLRIAQDLHDSLGGLLSTIKGHFSIIQKEIEQLQEFNLTAKTNRLIDDACLEVRRISHNMMPHALSLSGLKGTIEDLGEQLSEEGYKTTIEINNIPEKIDPTRTATIYRLIQEIISNIRKHAKAKSILIQLLGHKKNITLLIEDDGIGFNYENAKKNGGVGLKSIDSRVQYLDGCIDWDSQPNKGTSIIINIPIK